MQATIHYIEKELNPIYPKTEIQSLTRILIESVTGWNYSEQLLNKNYELNEEKFKKIKSIVRRLKNYEPIQYILGETTFCDLTINVNPSVLIPRPETEELVQFILEKVTGNCSILDIGTGSGCIALALKSRLKTAKIYGTDISNKALQVARKNADNNNLDVNFFQADILLWENQKWNKFDVIISNPPYVRESEKMQMLPNVLEYEPAEALFVSDDDSLLFYRRITEFALKWLNEEGLLFFEINENLANEIYKLLKFFGFKNIELRDDINGKKRMIYGTI